MNGKDLIKWIKKNKLEDCDIKIELMCVSGNTEETEIESTDIYHRNEDNGGTVGVISVYDVSFSKINIE